MNEFGEHLEEALETRGIDLEDLPELLLDHGADDYDMVILDVTLRGPLTHGTRLGWHPDTWYALSKVLDQPDKEHMVPILKTFYGLPNR